MKDLAAFITTLLLVATLGLSAYTAVEFCRGARECIPDSITTWGI